MSSTDFLVFYACVLAVILACRCVPLLTLGGRELSPRVSEALGLIPPAAFAALVANDLFFPGMFDAGPWPAAAPLVAAGVVALVAWRTRSLLWCAVSGVAAYALLSLV